MKFKIGIYDLHMMARGGGEKKTLALAEHLSQSHDVWLFVDQPIDKIALERYFGVSLDSVKVMPLRADCPEVASKRKRFALHRWLTRQELHHFRQIKSLKLDLFINISHGSNLICPATRGIYMCMFPHPLRSKGDSRRVYRWVFDWLERLTLGHSVRNFLDSYSVVTANSCFTAEWIRKLWRRNSEVIYSVCDSMGPVDSKEKIILNVGRFLSRSSGITYKGQEILLDVFTQLTHAQSQGWQLHFAGSVAMDAESSALAARLEEIAKGRPVFFHFNADLNTLRDLYRRASLYWHATGYGSSVRDEPLLQEHFGITTVEAMSAGAVPVVLNSGGQREIVAHEINGLLWDDLTGLARQTVRLMDDSHLLSRLSQQAVLSSSRFSRTAFTSRMDTIIELLMPGRPRELGSSK